MRVLLIAPSLRILGGQAVQAQRLLRVLNRDGVQVDFQPFNLMPDWVLRIKFVRTVAGVLAYALRLLIRIPRYDVVHLFSAGYSSYLFWSLPALAIAKLYSKPIILNYRDGQAEDHMLNWRTALPTLRMFDVIVTPSGFLVDVFARFNIRARSIFNIIDASSFRWRDRGPLRPVFLHNRILEPLYNVECALRAFHAVQLRHPEASLTVAHDGPSRAHLEEFARGLGLQHTRFVGRVPHARIAELYDEAEIYITSPDIDCMPGSLLECFSSGLPVVATMAGGIPYIARNEETALLVPLGDWKAMAEAAERLLADQNLVARLTRQAREELRRYNPEPVGEQWRALYREVLIPKP